MLGHAAVAAVLLLLALGAGSGTLALLQRFALLPASGPPPRSLAIALGLALLAQGCWWLALLGVLRPLPLALLAVAAAAPLGVSAARRLRAGDAASSRRAGNPRSALLLVAGTLPPFVLALYPPNGFDETLYHLPYAAAMASRGRLEALPMVRFPVFTQLAESLMAGLLLAADEVSAHLLQTLAVGGTAALLVAWGARTGARRAGWISAAVWLGSPLVVYLGATGYVEVDLALWTTAALLAAWHGRHRAAAGWWAVAGLLAGSAAATKYLGLYTVVAVVLLALRERQIWPPVAVAAGAVAAAAPTYVRLAVLTGNPVFPYFQRLFGLPPWRMIGVPTGWRDGLARVATLHWHALFTRPLAGWVPPPSPLFLLSLPVLAILALRLRALRGVLAFVLPYHALYLVAPSDVRYLLPVLPVWALGIGIAGVRLLVPEGARAGVSWLDAAGLAPPEPRRRLTVALAVVAFLPGPLYAGWRAARWGALPATPAARDDFLVRTIPGYGAVRYLDGRFPDGWRAYGLDFEQLRYFGRGGLVGDWVGPDSFFAVEPLLAEPARLHARLAAAGIPILVLPPRLVATLPPAFHARFRRLWGDPTAVVYRLRGATRPRADADRCAAVERGRAAWPQRGRAATWIRVTAVSSLASATASSSALTLPRIACASEASRSAAATSICSGSSANSASTVTTSSVTSAKPPESA